jgi:CO/xanthine dehydrogenase Mo-binding subunit
MGISDETMSIPSYAYTSAVCEVEVDPETGLVEVVRYTSIDDCGRAVNPMLIHGQSHGGIAQGIGQALWGLRRRRIQPFGRRLDQRFDVLVPEAGDAVRAHITADHALRPLPTASRAPNDCRYSGMPGNMGIPG